MPGLQLLFFFEMSSRVCVACIALVLCDGLTIGPDRLLRGAPPVSRRWCNRRHANAIACLAVVICAEIPDRVCLVCVALVVRNAWLSDFLAGCVGRSWLRLAAPIADAHMADICVAVILVGSGTSCLLCFHSVCATRTLDVGGGRRLCLVRLDSWLAVWHACWQLG